jgi:hypothetical protein
MSNDEIDRLHGRIDGLGNLITEVRDAVRDVASSLSQQQHVCSERMGAVNKHIDGIHRTLYGNGREGLDDRVKGLETQIHDRTHMQIGSGGQISIKAVVAIIAVVGTMLGGLMGYLPAIVEALAN